MFIVTMKSIFAALLITVVCMFSTTIETHIDIGTKNMATLVPQFNDMNNFVINKHKEYYEYLDSTFR